MTEETTIPVDRLVAVYVKMRDKRAQLLREYEEQDEAIKEQMEVLEADLLKLCKSIGADSLKTQHGTVIRSIKTRYWTSDWNSMHKFIMQHNMPELLEKRLSQTAMKQLLDENPDMTPPNLNVDSRYAITIRRS